MIIIYHGRRPYLPLLACSIHLGLSLEAEAFLRQGLHHAWQDKPLYVVGPDGAGDTICCLAHGRYAELYRRAMDGVGAIFAVALVWVNIDELLAGQALTLARRSAGELACWLPGLCGPRVRPLLEPVISDCLREWEGRR